MEGQIEIDDTFRNPKFRKGSRLQTFDRVAACPMWNQNWFTDKEWRIYLADIRKEHARKIKLLEILNGLNDKRIMDTL